MNYIRTKRITGNKYWNSRNGTNKLKEKNADKTVVKATVTNNCTTNSYQPLAASNFNFSEFHPKTARTPYITL